MLVFHPTECYWHTTGNKKKEGSNRCVVEKMCRSIYIPLELKAGKAGAGLRNVGHLIDSLRGQWSESNINNRNWRYVLRCVRGKRRISFEHATSESRSCCSCRSSIQLNNDWSVVNFVPKTLQEVTEIEKQTLKAKSLPLFELEAEKNLIAVWYKRETPSKRVSQ